MSNFIDGSKDAFGTAEAERHFSSNNTPHTSGVGAWKTAPPYGSSVWNPDTAPVGSENGQQNQTNPNPPGNSLFNAGKPSLPREVGVNYTPASQAGHKVTDDPFSLGSK